MWTGGDDGRVDNQKQNIFIKDKIAWIKLKRYIEIHICLWRAEGVVRKNDLKTSRNYAEKWEFRSTIIWKAPKVNYWAINWGKVHELTGLCHQVISTRNEPLKNRVIYKIRTHN